jgi:hypothetical protein
MAKRKWRKFMAQDWTADVKKYVSNADDLAIKGIIKHCGIALKSRDGSFVSCADKSERDRVRDSFLKKKLGSKESDGDLDKAIKDVCEKMKADRDKSRVAFYYLLAERYAKLAMSH